MKFAKKIGALFLAMYMHASMLANAHLIDKIGYKTELSTEELGPSNQNCKRVLPKVTSNFTLPPQTNSWWSSLIWQYASNEPFSQNIFAHPLAFKARSKGLGISYPTQVVLTPHSKPLKNINVQEYHYPYAEDLLVGIMGLNAPLAQVSSYSDWCVTAVWRENKRELQATIGKGFPFVYFTAKGDVVQIQCARPPKIWYNRNGVVGLTVNEHHYGIFGPQASTWTSGQTLVSLLGGKDYFSIALLPDNSLKTLEFFRLHAYAFVQKTQVEWVYDRPSGQIKTLFTTDTLLKERSPNLVNRPLLALYRHQYLNTKDPLTDYSFVSPRGKMIVIDSSCFSTTLPLIGVLPELPFVAQDGEDTFSRATLHRYVDEVYIQPPFMRWGTAPAVDIYSEGKAMSKISHLIDAADQAGHHEAKNFFLRELKEHLEKWFRASDTQFFFYDKEWKTLIGYPASFGSNTQLNDHHAHYGYFLQAAATIAKYDLDWASMWAPMIELLIKDVSNWDRTDLSFPFLRNFDPYEGHSWTNGPALFGSGNYHDICTESLHYASSLIFWGALTGNKTLEDLAVYLYTTEIFSVFQYWFDIDKAVFPKEFATPLLGIVWGDGGGYSVSWDELSLKGVNFLPIHAGSLYLSLHPDFFASHEDYFLNAHTAQKNISLAIKALYASKRALFELNQRTDFPHETEESKAHIYQWIHNLNQLGVLDSTITADIPTAIVFNCASKRTYTAFNPTPNLITVHFSDGYCLEVPPLKVTASEGL